ncbi:hypothetical protein [Mycobacterium sp.]|jgi:hypothetical protein|uniref:hypothetical protein n=1 Tax=Mycobacterium sp. TaxID=1785 RepID=UPI002D33CD39|nr:hypothetical protein [Mycobacterium sp.]HZA09792.1 hypothetical protein [Mycobacterium sp.]
MALTSMDDLPQRYAHLVGAGRKNRPRTLARYSLVVIGWMWALKFASYEQSLVSERPLRLSGVVV